MLVLSGKREVPESFFIETLTGVCHPLTHNVYLGIESVWNHKNYWVNMQDCSHGVQVGSDDEEVLYSVYGGKRDSQTKYIWTLGGG